VIIKGTSRAGPARLATHLGNAEKNERVAVLETRGTIASDLRGALIEMDALAAGTRCEKPLYHAAISPEPPHRLSDEQRREAIDTLEARLGLDGHARVVVMHEKEGREHIHVVWSRIDLERMRSVSDGHNYRKHEEVARELERRFGHDRVQGAHAEREGLEGKTPRPDRTPSRAALRQEERTGITGKEVKAEVSALYRASDGPEAFKAALAENGYTLAKGDRRDFVIIDQAGGVHSLARRLDGVKAADLRAFMSPLDRDRLPDAEQAKAAALARRAEAQHDEAGLEKAYSRGGDYVSQSRAAQKQHALRQAQLDARGSTGDRSDRIGGGEIERAGEREDASHRAEGDEAIGSQQRAAAQANDATHEPPGSAPEEAAVLGDVEITDAMQARLDRLNEHKSGLGGGRRRDGPGPQQGAPGGGHTRSR